MLHVNGKEGATKMLRTLIFPPTFVQADGASFGETGEEEVASYDEWKKM